MSKTSYEIICGLAERLKSYRHAARLSQEEMARNAGVSKSTLSKFEQGVTSNISLSNFIALLRVVGEDESIDRLLPPLPFSPEDLKKINKLIPKRKRKK